MNHRSHDPETCSHCRGHDGRAKRAYDSRREAEDAASHVGERRGVSLRAYQCEYSHRWHLTSNQSGGW